LDFSKTDLIPHYKYHYIRFLQRFKPIRYFLWIWWIQAI